MTILLTGTTGLVGARLLPRLVEAGLDCRALVRSGRPAPDGASALEGDLLDPASLVTAVTGVSAIIHLAAVFRSPDADLIWRSNLEGTRNLIAATKAHAPDARFIMASTSNIYDAHSPRPGREDDDADPKQAYPASKLAAENVLRDSGLTWSIQRFGFVYGDQDGHLEALPGHAVSGGMHPAQRMSLVHHRDIAGAMTLAMAGAMDGRIVNIVDDAPTSIFELVALAGGTMASSAEPLTNPWRLHVDGSLARSLGFQPTVRTVHQAVQEDLM
ncbi:NAD(P)-dependent oxidoreductase [Caulobacter sp.]|uniref:NAD-dependent epimerase/dehydratase family protein n=1 Tax=Caulobacter sp. TaxID=78 RepID=UPI001B1B7666|nr:NAD(P)-dependent oxidoreductase [Caulobacter sp.]MBO9547329.1 NAD(P)-dependent oxidoreductase [Caulobacter sp.]